MFRVMAVACGLGALAATSQAQVIDAGQVSITVPEAGYALSSPREYGDYSDLLGNYSVVANGLKYNVAQQLSADSLFWVQRVRPPRRLVPRHVRS